MRKTKLFKKIRSLVTKIPKGKVSTYGDIARMAGIRDARIVGWAIAGNTDPKIPCQRVVKADGSVAENYGDADWREQKSRLLDEGITFVTQKKIDLDKHHWNGKLIKN
jgi:methylated-DNA-protein-cysteine methyltransferase-like protein